MVLFTINGIANEAKDATTEKQHGEEVGKLHQKLDVPRRQFWRSQPVFAILGAVFEHTLVGKTAIQGATEVLVHISFGPRVFDEINIFTKRLGARSLFAYS